MPKFKMSAGAEFDILNKDELDASIGKLLEDWKVEAARGPKHVRFSGNATVAADNTLNIGGSANPLSGRLGPDQSFVWSVKRWAIRGLYAGDSLSAYINNASPSALIKDGVTAYDRFGSDELVLVGGDLLLWSGAEMLTPVGTTVFVSGAAWELPATLTYRLL